MPFLKGKAPWNKGLKLKETHPQMGYQKGHKFFAGGEKGWFRKGLSASSQTQFQKGKESWNKGKKGYYKHTEEWKKERSLAMSGSSHPLWIEDRTRLKRHRHKMYDSAYRYWMRSVKNRDDWKCKISNKDCHGILEAHHILNWIDYPELRYQVNNGITLCHAHHPRGRAKEKQMIPTFLELLVSSEII